MKDRIPFRIQPFPGVSSPTRVVGIFDWLDYITWDHYPIWMRPSCFSRSNLFTNDRAHFILQFYTVQALPGSQGTEKFILLFNLALLL